MKLFCWTHLLWRFFFFIEKPSLFSHQFPFFFPTFFRLFKSLSITTIGSALLLSGRWVHSHSNHFSSLRLNIKTLNPKEKGKEYLFTVTFDGALRAWALHDMMQVHDALPLRLILQDLGEMGELYIHPKVPELMMVLTKKDAVVWFFRAQTF